jgi:hypothetical protein
VVGAPSGTLPDPLGDTAQREVQASKIAAAPAALPGILGPDRLAWHVPGQAVPPALPADRLAERGRHHPADAGQVAEHRVLVREILPGGLGVIAAQYETLPAIGLDQPVPVPARNVAERDDPARPNAEQVQHLVGVVGRHRPYAERRRCARRAG